MGGFLWGSVTFAAVLVLTVLVVAYASGHRCFLDVLNSFIVKSSDFREFYAGLPGLPPCREVVPGIGALEDAFPTIQREALDVFAQQHLAQVRSGGAGVPRMDHLYNNIFGKGAGGSRLAGLFARLVYGKDVDIFDKIGSDGWRTFNLIIYNRDVPGNVDACPEMVRLLKGVQGMQSALISILAPGASIPPHNDPAKGVIRYHLAFLVPRERHKCFIAVNGFRYHWRVGESVLFDDVFDHWVENRTDEFRVILFVDILRPLAGLASHLQSLANFANYHHPGVRRLISASRV